MMVNLSTVMSLVAISISTPLLLYESYWMVKHGSQVRRFFKLLVTGKYESPKKEA